MAEVSSTAGVDPASRRIKHPHASYTSSGTLTCLVCRMPIQSASLWEGHLRSATHVTRSRQPSEGVSSIPAESRKRKASEDDGETDKIKRSKASQPASSLPQDFFDESAALEAAHLPGEPDALARRPSTEMASHPKRSPPATSSTNLPSDFFDSSAGPAPAATSRHAAADAAAAETVDEDEYAAFEREIAAAAAPSLVAGGATISAAPVSAAELAARATAAANAQKKDQEDADIEGEQEDAVRRMEVEIDEMEELEERVKRLRDRREELRKRADTKGGEVEMNGVEDRGLKKPDEVEDDEDDDDDGVDWDDWAFRSA